MSTRRFLFIAPLAALVVLSAGCGSEAERAEDDLAPVTARLAVVEEASETRSIEVYGTVQPARQSFVSSRVMGPVVSMKIQPGDLVRKGQVLLEIEPSASDGQVAQARGALAQAQAALVLAEKNFHRYEALYAENAASELELDMARMQHEQALGAVEQAEGAVRAASSVADEARVRAPFAARVVSKLAEVGDLAAPGKPLVRLESLAGRQVWLNVREADIRRVEKGAGIDVRFDALPGNEPVTGTVDVVIPAADPATHTFTVKVGLEGVEVASGSSARGFLPGDEVRRLAVPLSAVHRRGGLELAVVRGEDGLARTRAVTTGRELGGGRVEVFSGLAAGEEVLIDAPGPLPDGTPVEVSR
jgi:RND family efflux transporter MFP subunit